MVELEVDEDNHQIKRSTVRDLDQDAIVRGSISFPEHLYERLRRYAFEQHVSIGSVVRAAVDLYLGGKKEEEDDDDDL